METRLNPLLVLPQSKLVENTTKYIQIRLDLDKCFRDWICPQNLFSALAPTKFYKSQNQYLPTDNIPQLEADASLLDLSNKGRASIPLKNLEAWERKARKLVSINSHADLFSSAAFLCLQQESMSVVALSRLLEAIAKSIKHATAMSTLLATEIFQARWDAALASSKLLLDNSSFELRNAPVNSKTLFDGRIKEIAKSNFEAQQQRFLASTSIQSQSRSFKPPTKPASVAQLDAPSNWSPGGHGFNPRRGRQHSFVEIDHEIFYSHSLPSADSRRAVVSFLRKNVHNTG